jgi:transposase-like protein/predicted RNA-binding Zn-ribbon protein involved in translation (DUF1610 family)
MIARLDVAIKILDADFRSHPCPRCGTESARRYGATRHALDIGLDRPVLLQINVGVYRCPRCRKKRYFRTPLNFIEPGHLYVDRCRQKLVESVVLDQMPISRAVKRMARDFNLDIVPSTGWQWYHDARPGAGEIADYEHLVVASFSGALCVDEVYDGGYAILCARDPLTKRTIAYQLSEKMNQEVVTDFFTQLKAMGIEPDVVATDDSPLYPKALKIVWGAVKHQLCRFHWTRNIVKAVNKGVRDYREGLPKPEKRVKRGRPAKDEAEARSQAVTEQSARDEVRKGRFLLVSNPESLDDEKRKRLEELIGHHPQLEIVRRFMDDFYGIFAGKPRPKDAEWRRQYLVSRSEYQGNPILADALAILADKAKFQKVVVYLSYDNLNSTSNDVERDNRNFRKRQKTHYRFRSSHGLAVLLDRQLLRDGPPTIDTRLKRRFGNPNWTKTKAT